MQHNSPHFSLLSSGVWPLQWKDGCLHTTSRMISSDYFYFSNLLTVLLWSCRNVPSCAIKCSPNGRHLAVAISHPPMPPSPIHFVATPPPPFFPWVSTTKGHPNLMAN